jgi:hypothetical protein
MLRHEVFEQNTCWWYEYFTIIFLLLYHKNVTEFSKTWTRPLLWPHTRA